MQNPLKIHPKIDAEKSVKKEPTTRRCCSTPWAPEHLQFNKMLRRKCTKVKQPTEGNLQKVTYLRRKTKGGQHFGGKIPEGDLQRVFYWGKVQKGDLRRVFYWGKVQKGDLRRVFYWGKVLKGDLRRVFYWGKVLKGDLQEGNSQEDANTPWAPAGPERIKVAYGKVPLRAGWVRMLCKGRGSLGEGSYVFLQMFRETGCWKLGKRSPKGGVPPSIFGTIFGPKSI